MKQPSTATIAAALKRHEGRLLKKSHVVGVGIGEKITAGARPGAGGLLFAGSDRVTLCHPIQEVFARLAVRL